MSDQNRKQDSKETYSLEENLRQRAYYEKYYEDLAAHASHMDELGNHDLAELDREEMKYASSVLGDLVAEKNEFEEKQLHSLNHAEPPAEKFGNEKQSDIHLHNQQTTSPATEQKATVEQSDIISKAETTEEGLIPADKSHFTDEALEAEEWADEQLAKDEAEMEERIKIAENAIENNEQAQQSLSPSEPLHKEMHSEEALKEANQNELKNINISEPDEKMSENTVQKVEGGKDTPSQEEDYYYGYGM
jgi:hypothetical protein